MSSNALPLTGVRVAVTRPAHVAAELAGALMAAGAAPVLLPLTRIVAPLDDARLRETARDLSRYDWLIFTSANAVRAFAAAGASEPEPKTRIAAIGSATANAVREILMRDSDVVPATFSAAALVPAMEEVAALRSARILWPRAEAADDRLASALARAGAVLDDPIAYRSECSVESAHELVRLERDGGLDAITFTAPSAVDCYVSARPAGTTCVIAVIGRTTAAAARAHGMPVHVEPEQPIISALVAALARHYVERSG